MSPARDRLGGNSILRLHSCEQMNRSRLTPQVPALLEDDQSSSSEEEEEEEEDDDEQKKSEEAPVDKKVFKAVCPPAET